jgi:hypothetical protein
MNLTSHEALLLYNLTSYDTPEWNFIHCSDLCGICLKPPISNVLMTIMLQDRMWKNENKKKRPQENPLSPRYFLTLHACEDTFAQRRSAATVSAGSGRRSSAANEPLSPCCPPRASSRSIPRWDG